HGKPALVPHHGTLLRVSPDGSRTDILATGFRAPNGVCVNVDGSFFLTDQEGHWIPKNRINWVRPDRKFFGNMWGYSDVTDPADGHLYLCGMYAWAGNQQAPGGLYRIRATGRPVDLPVGYHVTKTGLALTFSDPLAHESVANVKNFGLKVWDLKRSANYGSP